MGYFEIKIIIDKKAKFPDDKYLVFQVFSHRDQIDKFIELVGEDTIEYIEEL